MRLPLVLTAIMLLISLRNSGVRAQQQVGPIYPEKPAPITVAPSGYDPFQLDWATGRFNYVPIPYSAADASGPYYFNWHSGRWDYLPYPTPTSVQPLPTNTPERTPPPLPNIANVYRGAGAAAGPQAMQAGARIEPGAGESVFIRFPTTRPAGRATTQPTSGQPSRLRAQPTTDPLHLDPNVGRWQRDRNTGKLIHILPSDE